jgi:hypothetical protein
VEISVSPEKLPRIVEQRRLVIVVRSFRDSAWLDCRNCPATADLAMR